MKQQTVKYLALALLTITLSGVVLAKKPEKSVKLPSIVEINQRFVKVNDRLYADKYETTVADYLLFLSEQKSKGVDCAPLMCDSVAWIEDMGWQGLLPFHRAFDYFDSPAFTYYPVICISYSAVQQFCLWLTEKYNTSAQKTYTKVIFRLPSKKEFIKAAAGKYDENTIDYPWKTSRLYDNKMEKICNFLEIAQEEVDYQQDEMGNMVFFYHNSPSLYPELTPSYSYSPNSIGLYNVVGNVAEMVQEVGIAMGGSWRSSGYNVKIHSEQKYTAPSTTIGFRVFMEIVQE